MKLGPYELDSIVAGECAGLMDAMPEGCIDLTVTSPPYDNLREYQGYIFDFEAIARQLWRITKPGGVVVWVVGDATISGSETGTSFRQALRFKELGFNLHDTMIFHHNSPPSVAVMQKRYEQHFDYMFILTRGFPTTCNHLTERKTYIDNRQLKEGQRLPNGAKTWRKKSLNETKIKGNVWFFNVGGGLSTSDISAYKHPAIFPEALARDHILSWSNPGDIVFDPMVGSGTTCKMAKELGRHWLGFDISPEYVEIARKRVEFAKTPLFNL